MSGQDLIEELSGKMHLLDSALKQLGKRGREYAAAEQEYRVELAKKILLERESGTPVTVINDICRGDTGIARLKFNRDVTETSYKAALEAINIYKLQAKILESQIDREWKNA